MRSCLLSQNGLRFAKNTAFTAFRQKLINTEHQTPNTEHRTPNTKHRTPNTEHRTPLDTIYPIMPREPKKLISSHLP